MFRGSRHRDIEVMRSRSVHKLFSVLCRCGNKKSKSSASDHSLASWTDVREMSHMYSCESRNLQRAASVSTVRGT